MTEMSKGKHTNESHKRTQKVPMTEYTQENYAEYCEFIRGEGFEPSSFETWVAWNEAVTASYEDDPDILEDMPIGITPDRTLDPEYELDDPDPQTVREAIKKIRKSKRLGKGAV